jgi:hypothetical protein
MSQILWLISAKDESRETFDVILSTKSMFFKSGFGGRMRPGSFHTLLPDPLLGYYPGSQNTCPNEILEICGVFLYGVTMILFLCVRSGRTA